MPKLDGTYGEIDPIPMGNTYAPLNSMCKAKKFTVLNATTTAQEHTFNGSSRSTEFMAIMSDPTAVVYLRRQKSGETGASFAAAGSDGACDAFLASGQKEQLAKDPDVLRVSYVVSTGTAVIQVLSR